jgi:hypothetical protein
MRDPVATPADALTRPDGLDLTFEGWTAETFALLDRLRAHPHIEQYRKEKPGVYDHLKDPFKRYRDDLVVNWVLPNRLDFETEKNVFSRLLKNDFGAGGCHDNLWMAFYRPETKRLKDVQLSHSVSPDGFDVGLYVGAYATDLLARAKANVEAAPARYLALVNGLLAHDDYRFYFYYKKSGDKVTERFDAPLDALPATLARADGIWLRRRVPRADVLALGPALVRAALDTLDALWPVYRLYLR